MEVRQPAIWRTRNNGNSDTSFKMADLETSTDVPEISGDEIMRKKSESENSKSTPHDEDSESAEEQPLDVGIHYLVRRSDNSWCKYAALFILTSKGGFRVFVLLAG